MIGTGIAGILFDKDGTLIEFDRTWASAYSAAAKAVAARAQRPELEEQLLLASGYDRRNGRWEAGSILTCGTNERIAEFWCEFAGMDNAELLHQDIESIFHSETTQRPYPTTNLQSLLGQLQAQGLQLGLATMDSVRNARDTLETLDLVGNLNFICGFDSGFGAKPEAGMVEAFCRVTQLTSEQVAVVGDSPVDLQMARNAGAGLAIGVLSGAHGREELEELADTLIADVSQIAQLLAGCRKTPPGIS